MRLRGGNSGQEFLNLKTAASVAQTGKAVYEVL
jgi:hypothetical protein